MTDKLVPVYEVLCESTGDIVKIALEEAGIPAVLQRNETSAYGQIFVAAEGSWGQVLVREADVEKARKVLEEYEKTGNESLEEEFS